MATIEITEPLRSFYCELSVLKKKKVWKRAKIFLLPSQAKVAPPVSSILGQFGINLIGFCEKFNTASKHLDQDIPVSVYIVVFSDKTFRFKIKPISLNELAFSCNFNSFLFKDIFLSNDKKNDFLVSFYKFYLCSSHQIGVFDYMFPCKESLVHIKSLISYLKSYSNKKY
jgi:hypothetical protein